MSDYTDGYIYVDYSQMSNAADDMISQTRAIATTMSSLEQELNALRNSWIGDDKDVYDGKQRAWDNAVKGMEELLTKHSALLTTVSENYQYSERSLTQMWDSVKIGR
ncbi:WXG100 family type VII secretion target [Streptomyces sp. B3I7]|jgi:WXG100 family type VII secretion target|uniref:WXG100 family type VII secretion target n=1 Tax=unclassified Streptomyces TaxID=2593676 RepID=UPI0027827E79|nr:MULTISPECIES: WXG100 family type VII secretion target [unclassified Streptomyces]MDQ0784820.1 WXG100 family type VII secretion target [Streptomyces sp. B3I8]MDQ0808599.1 WXG100 family type VII secretion target [Streptomyces sp. B3I7]